MNILFSPQEAMYNSFHLSPAQIKLCDKYYILYWESRYLRSQLLASDKLKRQGISYTPIFLVPELESELATKPEQVVKVSFRRLKGQSSGYALITYTTVVKEV